MNSPEFINANSSVLKTNNPEKDTSLTPLFIVHSLGKFNLDPCGLNFHKTAENIIEWPQDGLNINWNGRIWLNPPYSNPTPWLEKLAIHKNGIALILNSTDTQWFHEQIFDKCDSLFFLRKRPKFLRRNLTEFSIMRGVVLVAYGEENSEKLRLCGLYGKFMKNE